MTDTDTAEDESAMLSIQEVADRLGIGKNSAYRAAADGSIPSVRIGGRILVPVALFNKMLDPPIPESMIATLRVPTSLPRPRVRARERGQFMRRYTDEDDRIITEDYLNYVPTEEIAEKLQRSDGTIRQRILKLGLRRHIGVSKLMTWAPEHLRARVTEMDPDEWMAAVYADRDQTYKDGKAAHSAEAARVHAERLEQAKAVDERTDLSRNDKMKAKRMLGLTLEEIGAQYGITRERVRQLTDANYSPAKYTPVMSPMEKLARLSERNERERGRIIQDAVQRLVMLWEATPPEAQDKFRAMIDGGESDDQTTP